MARKASSFERTTARYKPQAKVLVICEDSKSCLNYLTDAARHFRSYAEVEIFHCGKTDPRGIVAEAVARRKKFDAVYCAIDRDTHHHFEAALTLAAEQDVNVMASHPCYEFWLLLHFRYTRAPYAAAGEMSAGDRVVGALREQPGMDRYRKGSDTGLFAALIERLPTAKERASQAMAEALLDNEMNPSTRLHELIDVLEQLGTLRPTEQ